MVFDYLANNLYCIDRGTVKVHSLNNNKREILMSSYDMIMGRSCSIVAPFKGMMFIAFEAGDQVYIGKYHLIRGMIILKSLHILNYVQSLNPCIHAMLNKMKAVRIFACQLDQMRFNVPVTLNANRVVTALENCKDAMSMIVKN